MFSLSIHDANMSADRSTNAIDGRFVHHQLLIDCLLRMEPTKNDKHEFLTYCRKTYHDPKDIKTINEFERTYRSDCALSWYTKDAILYRVLNQSLRRQDIDVLFTLRFFIRDLQDELTKRQCKNPTTLYRGQRISQDELTILKQSQGKLISTNSFLSTTIYSDIACRFCSPSANDDKYENVTFEINVLEYRDGMKPFANIETLSDFPQENETLMMLGSVFRLDKIEQNSEQIWIISMTLCSDSDHDLQAVFDHMRTQYESGQTRLLLFGHVLVDMAHFNDAEKYYFRLLNEISTNHPDRSKCYHALGKVACEKGDYQQSLHWLNKALELTKINFGENHSKLGFIYLSIGEVYQKQRAYELAFDVFERAQIIWTNVYHAKHEYVAWCLNNIGMIHDARKNYKRALKYLSDALEIKRRCLPSKHPCLGNTYLNLGNVYYNLRDYDRALKNYNEAYRIYESSLPYEHPSVASAGRNIGLVYEKKNQREKALSYYEKCAQIRSERYSQTHPDNIEINRDVKRVK